MSSIDLQKFRHEALSAKRYLQLSDSELRHIKSVVVEPPRLGYRGFGGLIVEYYSPRWGMPSEGAFDRTTANQGSAVNLVKVNE